MLIFLLAISEGWLGSEKILYLKKKKIAHISHIYSVNIDPNFIR